MAIKLIMLENPQKARSGADPNFRRHACLSINRLSEIKKKFGQTFFMSTRNSEMVLK